MSALILRSIYITTCTMTEKWLPQQLLRLTLKSKGKLTDIKKATVLLTLIGKKRLK